VQYFEMSLSDLLIDMYCTKKLFIWRSSHGEFEAKPFFCCSPLNASSQNFSSSMKSWAGTMGLLFFGIGVPLILDCFCFLYVLFVLICDVLVIVLWCLIDSCFPDYVSSLAFLCVIWFGEMVNSWWCVNVVLMLWCFSIVPHHTVFTYCIHLISQVRKEKSVIC